MSFLALTDHEVADLKIGARIVINPAWLSACGKSKHEGAAFVVTDVRDHGSRGVMVDVVDPTGYAWTVWSLRGVALYVEPAAQVEAQDAPAQADKPGRWMHHFPTRRDHVNRADLSASAWAEAYGKSYRVEHDRFVLPNRKAVTCYALRVGAGYYVATFALASHATPLHEVAASLGLVRKSSPSR